MPLEEVSNVYLCYEYVISWYPRLEQSTFHNESFYFTKLIDKLLTNFLLITSPAETLS